MNVLILCTGNSARSILAEAILNREGSGRFRAYSAGSQPKGVPHPEALRLLASLGYDVAFARSKSWDVFTGPDAPRIDLVITVCDSAAAEVCPTFPGAPMVGGFGIADPAAVTGPQVEVERAFRRAYHDLMTRIKALVALPIETMDAASLSRALTVIGSMPETAAEALEPA